MLIDRSDTWKCLKLSDELGQGREVAGCSLGEKVDEERVRRDRPTVMCVQHHWLTERDPGNQSDAKEKKTSATDKL